VKRKTCKSVKVNAMFKVIRRSEDDKSTIAANMAVPVIEATLSRDPASSKARSSVKIV